jgi:hypothetical protein
MINGQSSAAARGPINILRVMLNAHISLLKKMYYLGSVAYYPAVA